MTVPAAERVLVLAPFGRDATVLLALLREAGFDAVACAGPGPLGTELERGVGALVLTAEALAVEGVRVLAAFLVAEPPWSAPPLVLLVDDDGQCAPAVAALRRVRSGLGVGVLLRPAPAAEVRSAVEVALGARRAQYAIRDLIEAHRRSEEQARFLVREIDHRVKNLLTTITGVASQTLKQSPTPEAFAESFAGRLRALSESYDALGRNAWRGADLAEIVHRCVAPFRPAGGQGAGGAEISGPAVGLPPHAGTALGMYLHELATNAAKYGALSVPGGRVSVTWRLEGGGDGWRLALTWRESGGPPVAPPGRRGFGTNLIERGIGMELDGSASIEFRRDGLVCTMEVPLPATDDDHGDDNPDRS